MEEPVRVKKIRNKFGLCKNCHKPVRWRKDNDIQCIGGGRTLVHIDTGRALCYPDTYATE